MENAILRNSLINAARLGYQGAKPLYWESTRVLYACVRCQFWPTPWNDPTCERCLVEQGLFCMLSSRCK